MKYYKLAFTKLKKLQAEVNSLDNIYIVSLADYFDLEFNDICDITTDFVLNDEGSFNQMIEEIKKLVVYEFKIHDDFLEPPKEFLKYNPNLKEGDEVSIEIIGGKNG